MLLKDQHRDGVTSVLGCVTNEEVDSLFYGAFSRGGVVCTTNISGGVSRHSWVSF